MNQARSERTFPKLTHLYVKIMSRKSKNNAIEKVEDVILMVRGQRVILDANLARIYGVPTFRFNEAVKRNRARFPEDFMFRLTRDEVDTLISQNAMSKPGRGERVNLG